MWEHQILIIMFQKIVLLILGIFLDNDRQLDAKKLYEHLQSINHKEFAKKTF